MIGPDDRDRISDRLDKLERWLDPPPRVPRVVAEARERLLKMVNNVMTALAGGAEPNNEIGRWIVAYDGDVAAA